MQAVRASAAATHAGPRCQPPALPASHAPAHAPLASDRARPGLSAGEDADAAGLMPQFHSPDGKLCGQRGGSTGRPTRAAQRGASKQEHAPSVEACHGAAVAPVAPESRHQTAHHTGRPRPPAPRQPPLSTPCDSAQRTASTVGGDRRVQCLRTTAAAGCAAARAVSSGVVGRCAGTGHVLPHTRTMPPVIAPPPSCGKQRGSRRMSRCAHKLHI